MVVSLCVVEWMYIFLCEGVILEIYVFKLLCIGKYRGKIERRD
jgi:hypothetical protein